MLRNLTSRYELVIKQLKSAESSQTKWICTNCGLTNDKFRIQCQACFSCRPNQSTFNLKTKKSKLEMSNDIDLAVDEKIQYELYKKKQKQKQNVSISEHDESFDSLSFKSLSADSRLSVTPKYHTLNVNDPERIRLQKQYDEYLKKNAKLVSSDSRSNNNVDSENKQNNKNDIGYNDESDDESSDEYDSERSFSIKLRVVNYDAPAGYHENEQVGIEMMSEKQTNIDFSRFENEQKCNGKESDINEC
eukprot:4012_1